ncbi:hypothetical protein FBU30_004004 [Linnemannia zychae]|nr:hypothetical protein FBU30_004004 [Linnemannia zychae]
MSNVREQESIDMWSWLTASRIMSNEQRQQEDQDDARGLAQHQLNLHSRFPMAFANVRQINPQSGNHSGNPKTENTDDDSVFDKGMQPVVQRGLSTKTLYKLSKETVECDFKTQDWVVLLVLTALGLIVRLWKISWPNKVILDEMNIGVLINGYIKGELVLDSHPPLGKLILVGVSSLSSYNGSFEFENFDKQYQEWVPYKAMRIAMATMGAICAPMAYTTLKAAGHGTTGAILAAIFVIFDNGMIANNRMIALDAPLMFFTAGTAMSWSIFIKNSERPFTGSWWTWLVITGVLMVCAMSTKLIGLMSAVTTLYFVSLNLWALALDKTIDAMTWMKHCLARIVALLVLPTFLYLIIFQVHFSIMTRQPDYRISIRAESDLNQLSRLYRHSLTPYYATEDIVETWRDVVYGSVVRIQNDDKSIAGRDGNVYLHSSSESNLRDSRQQIVSGYSYPDINTNWIIIKAEIDSNEEPEEIPSRLELLKNGDLIRLRHVSTRKCLHSHNQRTFTYPHDRLVNEVSGYGGFEFDGDSNDWWVVEIVSSESLGLKEKQKIESVRALETTFRLKHFESDCYLSVGSLLPRPWGQDRTEVICRSKARITNKSIWRITHNRHDYYQTMVLLWSDYLQHVAVIANPMIWWSSLAGLGLYICSLVVFALRRKRGYYEIGRLGGKITGDFI